MEPSRPVRLIVLYGGRSAEHEVSCVSALHVVGAVDRDRYDLRMVGITTSGEWVDTTEAALSVGSSARALPSPDDVLSGEPGLSAGPGAAGLGVSLAGELLSESALTSESGLPSEAEPDVVVLPLLHGPMGEDGTVQGLLELAGIP